MRTIIAGTRTFDNCDLIYAILESCPWQITSVISGCHPDHVKRVTDLNVDIIGAKWAISNGIVTRFFWPEWDKYKKSAGPIRNRQMALVADALVLIWNGTSRGSANMKEIAELSELKIYEVVIRHDKRT